EIRNPQSAIRNSSWWLVTLDVSREAEEEASTLLFELGSTGIITLEESSDRLKLGAYFNEVTNAEEIKKSVEEVFERAAVGDALISCTITSVPEQDWMQKWKEGFEPVEIGERLIVAPSWKLPGKDERRVVIQIDPGMAFGTGTGILAIAAALLAPGSRVAAIDVDPQAIAVARENLEINGVSSSIELSEGQPRNCAGQSFDIVVANLTAEVIIILMDDLVSCLAPEGLMILSGILGEFAADVERSLVDSNLIVTNRHEAGEWCALIARRV